MKKGLLALFLLSALVGNAAKDSTKKKVRVFPVPTIGFTPETRWYFGGVSLFTLNLFDDSTTRMSTADVEINYSLNKQLIVEGNWFFNTKDNKHIVFGENSYLRFPELFWGFGNESSNDDETLYEANRLELYNGFLWSLGHSWFLGPVSRQQYLFGLEHDVEVEFGQKPEGWSSGLGVALLHDSRTQVLNPAPGSRYFLLENITSVGIFGSNSTFHTLKIDYRGYWSLFKKHTLAAQVFGLSNFGTPPFRMQALLGSSSHMRGYYTGRYRDLHYLTAQAEGRFKIYRGIGAAVFVGMGDVAGPNSSLTISNLKPSLGGGLRFRVDKEQGTNLRIDYAIGRENSGFYFSFGESF